MQTYLAQVLDQCESPDSYRGVTCAGVIILKKKLFNTSNITLRLENRSLTSY